MPPKKTASQALVAKRKEREKAAVQARGARCEVCTATDGLKFHHRPNTEKRWTHGSIWQHTDADREEELQKCDLLCKRCRDARDRETTQSTTTPEGVVIPPGADPSVAHHTLRHTWVKEHAMFCWRCQQILTAERERNQNKFDMEEYLVHMYLTSPAWFREEMDADERAEWEEAVKVQAAKDKAKKEGQKK
jgi:hypothetical protein